MVVDIPTLYKERPDVFLLENKGKSLFLRPLEAKDIPARFTILTRYPQITYFLTFEPPKNILEVEAHFYVYQKAFQKSQKIIWSIFYKKTLVGTISLEDIVFQEKAWERRSCRLGYWLLSEVQGRGLMSAALGLIVPFAFKVLKLHRIKGSCTVENIASARVMEKNGFQYLCTQKAYYRRFGRWWDLKRYELLALDAL